MNGRGAWTATVKIECEESANYPGCADLVNVHNFLGEPYAPETDDERKSIEEMWEFLRVPGDGPEKHLGEAETVAIITNRSLTALVVTDDTGAMRLARNNFLPVVTTAELMILAVKARRIELQAAWDCLRELQDTHGRALPRVPDTFADFRARCGMLGS
jgi:hypothetical protein